MSKPRSKTWNVEAQTKRLKRWSLDLMLETSKPRPNNWNVEAQTWCLKCWSPVLRPETSKPRPNAWNVEAWTWCLKRRSPDLITETSKPRLDAWNVETQTACLKRRSPNVMPYIVFHRSPITFHVFRGNAGAQTRSPEDSFSRSLVFNIRKVNVQAPKIALDPHKSARFRRSRNKISDFEKKMKFL